MNRVLVSADESCAFDRALQWVGQYPYERVNPRLPPTPILNNTDALRVLQEEYADHYSQTRNHKLNILKDPTQVIKQTERLQAIEGLIAVVTGYLSKYNITYWLDAGTLLGSFRHQRIIPWDTDGDIALTCDGVFKFSQILQKYPLPDDYLVILRVGPHQDVIPMKIADKRNGFYIDIIKWFPTNNKIALFWPAWCAKCRGRPPTAMVDIDTLFPLASCPFGDAMYSCPNKVSSYLSYWYVSTSVPRKFKNYDVKVAMAW